MLKKLFKVMSTELEGAARAIFVIGTSLAIIASLLLLQLDDQRWALLAISGGLILDITVIFTAYYIQRRRSLIAEPTNEDMR